MSLITQVLSNFTNLINRDTMSQSQISTAGDTTFSELQTILTELDTFKDQANALATGANTDATNAETAATNAGTSEENAYKWAQEDEDTEVDDGVNTGYSAYHWAQKATNGGLFSATSATSLTIAGSGSVSPVLAETNRAFAIGSRIRLAATTSPGTNMEGIVTEYNTTSDTLTVLLSTSSGSGTYTAWTVSLAVSGDASSVNGYVLPQYKTVYIDAGVMTLVATDGAEEDTIEYPINDINLDRLLFDDGTLEKRQVKFPMPEDWDLGPVKAMIYWSSDTGSTTGDTVEIGLKAGAFSNGDAIDAALGTGQVISDTLLADNGANWQITAATPAITIGGTPALHDMIVWEFYRNVSGTDDMEEDLTIMGARIQYKVLTTSPVEW